MRYIKQSEFFQTKERFDRSDVVAGNAQFLKVGDLSEVTDIFNGTGINGEVAQQDQIIEPVI